MFCTINNSIVSILAPKALSTFLIFFPEGGKENRIVESMEYV